MSEAIEEEKERAFLREYIDLCNNHQMNVRGDGCDLTVFNYNVTHLFGVVIDGRSKVVFDLERTETPGRWLSTYFTKAR